MFRIVDEHGLRQAFRPRDRRHLELPAGLTFPKVVLRYLSWVDPHGVRVYLVIQDPSSKRPLGIAFDREDAGGTGAQLCHWCHHASGTPGEVGLLTTARNSRKRVGVTVCRDLRCADRIEEAADRAGRSPLEPLRRLVEKMGRFAAEGLGIAAVPPP